MIPNKLFNIQAMGYWVTRNIARYGKIDYKERYTTKKRKDNTL